MQDRKLMEPRIQCTRKWSASMQDRKLKEPRIHCTRKWSECQLQL